MRWLKLLKSSAHKQTHTHHEDDDDDDSQGPHQRILLGAYLARRTRAFKSVSLIMGASRTFRGANNARCGTALVIMRAATFAFSLQSICYFYWSRFANANLLKKKRLNTVANLVDAEQRKGGDTHTNCDFAPSISRKMWTSDNNEQSHFVLGFSRVKQCKCTHKRTHTQQVKWKCLLVARFLICVTNCNICSSGQILYYIIL